MDKLIIATTSSTDIKVQNIIRQINHREKELEVEVWFWEKFQILIERNIELMYWYYSKYLEKVKKYNPDIHILTLHKQAFNGPAFQRKMYREESGGDFIQAIIDTQEAIRTGRLYNRRGDLITTSHPTDKLSNRKWRYEFQLIYQELDTIRDIYAQGVKHKRIKEHPTVLEILDDKLSEEFNKKRRICLIKVNEILEELEIELVESELI